MDDVMAVIERTFGSPAMSETESGALTTVHRDANALRRHAAYAKIINALRENGLNAYEERFDGPKHYAPGGCITEWMSQDVEREERLGNAIRKGPVDALTDLSSYLVMPIADDPTDPVKVMEAKRQRIPRMSVEGKELSFSRFEVKDGYVKVITQEGNVRLPCKRFVTSLCAEAPTKTS